MLAQAHATRRLDEATYEAAWAELDVAAKSHDVSTKEGAGRLVLALKRLLGLVSDLADLASKVSSIIDAVRGRS
jgi:hypothetical protein